MSNDRSHSTPTPPPSAPPPRRRGTLRRLLDRRVLVGALGLLLVASGLYVAHLERIVARHFAGSLWRIPARVYGRPLELHSGAELDEARLLRELALLGYEERDTSDAPGTYERDGDAFRLTTRDFRFGSGLERSRTLLVELSDGAVRAVRDTSGASVPLARLSPPPIGAILPASGEDRIIVDRASVPPLLVDAILAVEDRRFYSHPGVDLRGIVRAMLANVRAGSVVQGGSTLTQQLIRSTFLHNRRSFRRKVDEAFMALALERRHEKETILDAYLNEVYMGQDGHRAIHGFGLASYFYFDKPLEQLAPHEIALLVGMVKGPVAYDPRRRPDAARARRSVVLDVLVEQGLLTEEAADAARGRPLVRRRTRATHTGYYPAFLEVVRRELAADYDEEALSSAGLRILTNMDPFITAEAQRILDAELTAIATARVMPDSLEGAVVVTSAEGGELLAVIGGRDAGVQGFNRALHAGRAVGSILKPFVYLAALETGRYTLSSTVEDTLLEVPMPNGTTWAPRNFDEAFAGTVPLCQALMLSRNVPTVRLGLEIGVGRVVDVVARMGLGRTVPAYPSILLGAVPLSPLEVAQLYGGLAAGGFVTPLRAVREVLTSDGEPLQRYPLTLEPGADAGAVYQVARTLEATTELGTARGLRVAFPESFRIAGKTGTTDDYRDAWFAGFTGEHVAVVWVGRDDNAPTGLTGASGALPVWRALMREIATRPFDPVVPPGYEDALVDLLTGLEATDRCELAVRLPYPEGRVPDEKAPCASGDGNIARRAVGWLRDIFR